MNENGNSEQQDAAPLAAPPAPPVPPVPPVAAPPAPMAVPPGGPKQKMDVLFFILGFLSPALLLGLLGMLSAVLQSDIMVLSSQAFAGLLFFAFVAAFAVGKSKRIRRLWSYGLGGLAAYAFGGLLLLLAFGTCLIALTGSTL